MSGQGRAGVLWVAAVSVVGASRARAEGNYETVVTAAPPSAEVREDRTASGSVVLPADSPRAHDDLGTLMMEVPGVTATRTGSFASFTTLSLRGSNPDQVRFVVDGVPLNIAEGGAVDVSTLPLGDVERVEVYRGQSPITFGESALGGIVAITTRTPGTPFVTARAGAGSFGAYFGDATAGGRLGWLRAYAGVHVLEAQDDFPYANDNGTSLNPADDTISRRLNNDVSQVDGALRLAGDLPGRRTLGLSFMAFGRDQGLVGPHYVQTHSTRFATGRGLATLAYDSRDDLGEGGRLSARLFVSGQRDHYMDPSGELSAGAWDTRDTTVSSGTTVNASRPLASWLRLGAVGEARVETFRAANLAGMEPAGVPARRLVAVAGAEATFLWPWAGLELVPSARLEVLQDVVTGRDPLLQTNRSADPAVTRTLPILRVGLVRTLGAYAALKANVGRYARAPSFLELYAGMGRLLGNPALRPEWGTNADVALTVDAGDHLRVSSRTAVFGSRVDDLIEWEHDSYGHARAANVAAARILGAEQELRVSLGAWARLVGQVTYLHAIDRSGSTAHDGNQLPLRPRWQAYVRPELVRLAVPRGAGVGFAAFVDAALVAGAYDDPANLKRTATPPLVGAGVSVDVPRWGLRAVASAQNLANATTWDMAYWPLPGRTVFLSLGWQSAPPSSSQTTNPTRSN